MRILAVISDELIGADEGRDWAMLEALVAANGPASIEVRVLAIVNRPHESMLFGMPLGRAVGRASAPGGGSGYDPAESARHRLERALRYLRGLGLTGQRRYRQPGRLSSRAASRRRGGL